MSPEDGRVLKRSLSIAGHRTSVSLEAPFWQGLKQIARERGQSVQALVAEIDAKRGGHNLSSALRVWMRDVLGMSDDVKSLRQDARMEWRMMCGVGPSGSCRQALARDCLG